MLLTVITIVASTKIKCEKFRVGTWWNRRIYECEDKSTQILSKNFKKITGRTGLDHIENKSNLDVGSIWMDNTKIFFFPIHLEKIFPNLIAISITNCNMIEIHQADIKSLPQLQAIDLSDNKITVLENDLFKFNLNLNRLNLSGNKIIEVKLNVFEGMENLINLNFEQNLCYSGSAKAVRSAVESLVSDLMSYCYIEDINFSELVNQRAIELLTKN